MRIPSPIGSLAFAAILFSASVLAATPETSPATIPWNEIGAKAGAQYRGKALSVTAEGEGARLNCGFQKMEGRATREGLWLTSSTEGGQGERFRVAATGLGHGEAAGAALPLTGPVRVMESVARWERAGLAEEYSVSIDGVRQDFVVAARPAGEGPLRVDLTLTGAHAEAAPYGAKLTLEGSNRALAYSRLRVVDAKGKELTATMQVPTLDRLAIYVEDADAAYPVRVDPTISDANWVSLDNPSIPGVSGYVNAAVLDSSGNLYIGGRFGLVVTTFASNIAKWNGSSWSALGSGVSHPTINCEVTSLAASGTTLYAGGNFSVAGGVPVNGMAKWDGSAWSSLGAGTLNGYINALAVNSTTLYAGGNVSQTGGLPGITGHIAQMDLATGTWSGLGTPGPTGSRGLNMPVRALALRGTKLWVGGYFTKTLASPEVPASSIAVWDISTSTWSALGSGIPNANLGVQALAVSDTTVYAGGQFTTAGGVPVSNIAQWDIATSTWSALGAGTTPGGYRVYALALSGTTLYAGGEFVTAGGAPANRIAKYNISTGTWSALGSGMAGNNPIVQALVANGTTLYVGGPFTRAGGIEASGIAKWEDSTSTWSAFGAGMNGQVTALAVSDTKLYAGGAFSAAGSVSASAIAQWDGSSWSALGSGIGGQVLALAVDGSTLYAAGIFTTAGGVPANHIARWNGSTWSALGSGMSYRVNALAMSGSTLYAGGDFTTAGGVPAANIAQWDGSSWSALGQGVNDDVSTLAMSGTTLYAGGYFTTAGAVSASYIAQWNGSTWSALGAGMNSNVSALMVNGTTLYAGGNFTTAGAVSASRIAQWNGTSWSALGSGMNDQVSALAMSGTTLYAGGYFTTADGAPASHIAQWNGSAWSALASGTSNRVYALALNGTMLYAGGTFITVGAGTLSPYIGAVDLAAPTVTASTANLAATATSMVIHGTGFDWQASHNTVAFTPSGSGVVTSATSTSLTVTGLTGLTPGPLNAVVSTNGYTSGAPVQVATVIAVAPVVTTPTSASIAATSATLGGRVVSNGGATVTALGVVYSVTSTNASPQIGGTGVTNVTGTGSSGVFTVNATGLAPGVQYSFAAYATNSVGTTYTSPVSTFTTLSNVATLSNLVLSSGTLSPVFASGTLEYTAYVTSSTSTITLTPTTTDSNATIWVEWAFDYVQVTSGSASAGIDLSPGSNTITLYVNAEDGTPETYTVTVTQLAGLPDWRLTHFGTLANSGNLADTASYAGDGISNLMKYALGLNPLVTANPAALTTAVTGSSDPLLNDRLAIRFTLPNPAPGDVTYMVQASSDLISWTDVATNAHAGGWTWVADGGLSESHIVESDGGSTSTLQVGDLVPSSGNSPRMMRLQVTVP